MLHLKVMDTDRQSDFGAPERKKCERKRRKERPEGECGGRDLLGASWARERAASVWRVSPLECESAFARVFKCVCCGKTCPEEQRREPDSEVCVHCVRAAGFS